MSGYSSQSTGNRLLALLRNQDAAALLDRLEPVDLPVKMVIFEPDEVIPFVYFLDEGIASVVARSHEGLNIEAGFIGREGFVVPGVALGADTVPNLCQVQVAGYGHRITVSEFRVVMEGNRALRDLCLRFAQTLIIQTACTALSNAVHQIDERLARWLLMCHDRSPSDDLALTHEFMSVMLGTRRPTVTTALHVLEGNGFIRNDRGCVQIKNRAAMERFAEDSYGKPEEEYRKLIGPL